MTIRDEPTSAEDVVLYDIDIPETLDDVKEMLSDPDRRWFARKRLNVLARTGLIAAIFDKTKHPRGKDGKFIEVGGWVRWLVGLGVWKTGKVTNISANGDITVDTSASTAGTQTQDNTVTFGHAVAVSILLAAPAVKGHIALPDPASGGESAAFTKIGGQGGSNPGGLYEVTQDINVNGVTIKTGEKWYVKHGKSEQHIANELLANRLYELAGVSVADTQPGFNPNVLASRLVPSTDTKVDLAQSMDQATLDLVREDFVVDAWLANWDVAGLNLENIQVVDGVPYRIDAGGALLYRAQGSPKNASFGSTVGELKTMRDKGLNPQAGKVFGDVTGKQLQDGAKKVASVSPSEIEDVVAELGLPDSVADTIIARRQHVLNEFSITDPWTVEAMIVEEEAIEFANKAELDTPQFDLNSLKAIDEPLPPSFEMKGRKVEGLYLGTPFIGTVADSYLSSTNSSLYVTVTPQLGFTHAGVARAVITLAEINVMTGNDGTLFDKSAIRFLDDAGSTGATHQKSPLLRWDSEKWVSTTATPSMLIEQSRASMQKVLDEAVVVDQADIGFDDFFIGSDGRLYLSKEGPKTLDGWHISVDVLKGDGGPTAIFVPHKPIRLNQMQAFAYEAEMIGIQNAWISLLAQMPEWGDILDASTMKEGPGQYGTAYNPTFKTSFAGDGELPQYIVLPHITDNSVGRAVPVEGGKYIITDLQSGLPSPAQSIPPENDVRWVPPDDKFSQGVVEAWAALHYHGTDGTVVGPVPKHDLALIDVKAKINNEKSIGYDDVPPPPSDEVLLPPLTTGDAVSQVGLSGIVTATSVDGGFTVQWDNGLVHTYPWSDATLFKSTAIASPLPATPVSADGPPKVFDYANGKLSLGESWDASKMLSNPAMTAEALVGKVVYFYPTGFDNSGNSPDGSTITASLNGKNAQLLYVESYSNIQYNKENKLVTRDITGAQLSARVVSYSSGTPSVLGGGLGLGTFHIVTNMDVEAFKSIGKPTFKANGDIVLNGHVVGSWAKSDESTSSWYSDMQTSFVIFAPYSLTGKTTFGKGKKPTAVKQLVAKSLVPITPVVKAKKGSKTVKKIETYVAPAIPKTPGGSYASGEEATLGDWVQSTKGGGGFVGKIVGWPDQKMHPGLVFAVSNDGQQKIVKIKTQKKVTSSAGATEVPSLYGVPNAYTDLKFSDGNYPTVGQKVSAGKAGAEITGIVAGINTKQGWVYILTDDGKTVSKTFSVTKVVEQPELVWDPIVAVAISATGEINKVVPGSVGKKKGGKGPTYVLTEGATIDQTVEQKQEWLNGHPNRKLTKDGFVPEPGMVVRNSVGDQIVINFVAGAWGNPNKLQGFNLTKNKKASTSTSAVEVDHIVMTTSALTGGPLPKVTSAILVGDSGHEYFPAGTKIYMYTFQDYTYDSVTKKNRLRTYDVYLAVRSDGSIEKFTASGSGAVSTVLSNQNTVGENGFKPVAIVDATATQSLLISPFQKAKGFGETKTPFVPASATLIDPVNAPETKPIETVDLIDPVAVAQPETKPVEPVPDVVGDTATPIPPIVIGNLSALIPPPTPAKKKAEQTANLEPAIPAVGAPVSLNEPAPILAAPETIETAAIRMLAQKDSTAPGSGRTYALGDSDIVDDMLFRHQVERRGGKEYLVTRFRLREDVSEEVMAKIVTTSKTAAPKFGAWKTQGEEYPFDLKDGNAIYVRVSTTTHLLKPGLENSTAPAPNVRVLGDPYIVGKSMFNGQEVDLWRIRVVNSAGEIGEVDMQARPNGSVHVYEWDPDAPVPVANESMHFDTTSIAAESGWVRTGKMFMPGSSSSNPNDAGIADFGGGSLGTMAVGSGGSHIRRHLGDAVIDFDSALSVEGGIGNKTTRRANINGVVHIAIPIEDNKPVTSYMETLSRALQAVGVPAEKQQPPTPEQIVLAGLGKLVGTHHPTYKYRDKPLTGPNDPRVAETLAHMTGELQPYLKRPVTLSDVLMKQHASGRVQFVLSHEVAKAIAKRKGLTHFRHTGAGGVMESILAGPMQGLMSPDERWSLGVIDNLYMQPDMLIGSGDRVYMYNNNGHTYESGNIVMAGPMITSSLEIYNNENNSTDSYGRRGSSNVNWLTAHAVAETMYKRTIEPEMLTFYIVNSASAKNALIIKLKTRGITHINGRPLEEIIVTSTEAAQQGEITGIGATYWDDAVPLTDFIGADATTSAPTSVVV